jgi:hypothetical protein
MKNSIFTILLAFATISQAFAQEEPTSFTVAEFRGGYGISIFGDNLKEKYDAANIGTSGGGLASLAAFRKFKKINYLLVGLKFKSLGAAPAKGDNGQEMFFNYWGSALATKFFPFDKTARQGWYVQGDVFFVTQFTQKYRTVAKLEYNHQFAIGNGLAFGIGYDFPVGKNKTMLTLGIEYESDRRVGEVTGVGKKTFISSNIGVMTGFKF